MPQVPDYVINPSPFVVIVMTLFWHLLKFIFHMHILPTADQRSYLE